MPANLNYFFKDLIFVFSTWKKFSNAKHILSLFVKVLNIFFFPRPDMSIFYTLKHDKSRGHTLSLSYTSHNISLFHTHAHTTHRYTSTHTHTHNISFSNLHTHKCTLYLSLFHTHIMRMCVSRGVGEVQSMKVTGNN